MGSYKHEMYEKDLKKGTMIEMKEHGLSKKMACKIAGDNMRKNPNHYSKMKINYSVKRINKNISGIFGIRLWQKTIPLT